MTDKEANLFSNNSDKVNNTPTVQIDKNTVKNLPEWDLEPPQLLLNKEKK